MSDEENKTEGTNMASEPHIIGGAFWKKYDNDECPECGDSLEIETESKIPNEGYDSDSVRCVSCPWTGQLTVYEDGSCYVND